MAKKFSLSKALKVGLTSLAVAGACLLSSTASAGFVRTNGSQIVDEYGNQLFFNGANLGNWLVWEGYLMVGHNGYLTHSQFFDKLSRAAGSEQKAKDFERNWRLNYVTSDSIDELARLGYNSVRVPFNYKLFWDESRQQVKDDGFEFINRLIGYCRANNIRILLDMHGAPGYQNPGDHSDNIYSLGRGPDELGHAEDRATVKFFDGTTDTIAGPNVVIASKVWRHIANYYKNEDVIWGFDLLNEPVSKEGEGWRLLPAYKHMINAIREVNGNHIVVLEGDWWASYMDLFTTKIDSKMVLETHHYIHGNADDIPKLNDRVNLANNLGVPIILGEFGEEALNHLIQIRNIARDTTDGSFMWSFKKVNKGETLWNVTPPQSYNNVIYALENNQRASDADVNDIINNFAITGIQNKNPLAKMTFDKDFYLGTSSVIVDLSLPPCTRSPYKAVSIVDLVQAEDFDNGCKNSVYSDSTNGNEGGSYRSTDVDIGTTVDGGNGYYVGWTSAGEWLEYTVNVPAAGNYSINYRYATPYNSTYFEVASGSSSVRTYVNATAGWDSWNNAVSSPIYLAAGTQKIRITFSGGVNLNRFSAASSGALANGTYAIISKVSKKALDVRGWNRANEAIIQQYPYGGGANQKWNLIAEGSAFIIQDTNSGNVLDLTQGKTADGTKLQTYQFYPGNQNQRWKIEWNAARNAYTIKSVRLNAYNQQIAVDVDFGKVDDNLQMQVYPFSSGNINQEWDFVKQ